ncbi:glucose-1-phosphate cytidylyltransferase [Phreatobacter sp.]|uniref:glucose-1-phosphate cytidylyltransferase n=1 Tax=Phreatobacter sp. TaxID=1966341 RepID=UPI003F6F88AE
MRVVILAGGRGTRISEETDVKPKPMVDIGGRPILWHIMRHYAAQGFHDFVIAAGYKAEVIKRFFLDEIEMAGDLTVDSRHGRVSRAGQAAETWRVRIVDTGLDTNTGGRILRLKPLLSDGPFLVTYGDGVSNVPIDKVIASHRLNGSLATITAVHPPARFGGIRFDGEDIAGFVERPQIGEGWINGGFAVFEPGVFDYLARDGDAGALETSLYERLAREGRLGAYRHDGFWQCVDTLRELRLLQGMWDSGRAPWKTWMDLPTTSVEAA